MIIVTLFMSGIFFLASLYTALIMIGFIVRMVGWPLRAFWQSVFNMK